MRIKYFFAVFLMLFNLIDFCVGQEFEILCKGKSMSISYYDPVNQNLWLKNKGYDAVHSEVECYNLKDKEIRIIQPENPGKHDLLSIMEIDIKGTAWLYLLEKGAPTAFKDVPKNIGRVFTYANESLKEITNEIPSPNGKVGVKFILEDNTKGIWIPEVCNNQLLYYKNNEWTVFTKKQIKADVSHVMDVYHKGDDLYFRFEQDWYKTKLTDKIEFKHLDFIKRNSRIKSFKDFYFVYRPNVHFEIDVYDNRYNHLDRFYDHRGQIPGNCVIRQNNNNGDYVIYYGYWVIYNPDKGFYIKSFNHKTLKRSRIFFCQGKYYFFVKNHNEIYEYKENNLVPLNIKDSGIKLWTAFSYNDRLYFATKDSEYYNLVDGKVVKNERLSKYNDSYARFREDDILIIRKRKNGDIFFIKDELDINIREYFGKGSQANLIDAKMISFDGKEIVFISTDKGILKITF